MVRTLAAAAPGEDVSTALALANTRVDGPHGTVERLADVDAATEWLRRVVSETVPDADADDVQDIMQLRAAIRAVFTAAIRGERAAVDATETVNQVALADPGAPQLVWAAQSARVEWSGSNPRGVQWALASVARDAIGLLASGTTLRLCAAPDCNRLFIPDHGRRVWCSTTCGNRVRGSRHYALNKKVGS